PLSLPKLDSITGGYTFYYTTTGAIDLPALTTIKGGDTFSNLRTSTLTLRTNLKITKTSGLDNFYYCCSVTSISDTFLNLLYSTNEGTDMTEVILNLDTEATSPDAAVAGKWKMSGSYSEFLTKLKTITLRPAEGMVIPDSFTVAGAPWKTPLALTDTTPDSNGVYTWTKPST
ncbi:MAG: hypothetical protein LBI26_01590, partial [Holosporales bacterium]|nr:hypothetical protein [Holosporales bacterium]